MSSGFYVRPGLERKLNSARWSVEISPPCFSWGNEVSWKQEVKETLEKWGTKTRRRGQWSKERTVKKSDFPPEETRVLDPPTIRRLRLADGFILCISASSSNWTAELCRARHRIASDVLFKWVKTEFKKGSHIYTAWNNGFCDCSCQHQG